MKTIGKIAISVASVYIGVSALLSFEAFNRKASLPPKIYHLEKKLKNKKNSAPKPKDERVEWMRAQNFEKIEITNSRGHKLRGYYLPAEKPSDRYMLCSHGYRCDGMGEFRFISKFYHEIGFNLFIVDHVACGESEGDRISFGYYESIDLRQWIDYMLERFGKDIQIAMHGISMGSATVMLCCGMDDLPKNIKFAIADCGYTSVEDEFDYLLKKYHVPSAIIMKTVDSYNRMVSGFKFSHVQPINAVSDSKVPIFFAHGANDGFVPTFMVQRLYDACTADKDLLIVEHAGHQQAYPKGSEQYEDKINNFVKKYMA